MEFYEVVDRRRTIRDFEEREVPAETVERILKADMKAPTNNHLREWEFVVLRDRTRIAGMLEEVSGNADLQLQNVRASQQMGDCQRAMYLDAVPKQYRMLSGSGCLILPFYRQKGDLLRPETQSSLNAFAAAWCCVENILLAAAAEGLACSLRIPIGMEQEHVAARVKAPQGYVMPCYLGLGYPAGNAAVVQQPEIDFRSRIHFEEW